MCTSFRPFRRTPVTVCVCLVFAAGFASQEKAQGQVGKLTHVDSVKRDGLTSVTSVVVSRDGRFLYASAWNGATITVFSRDAKSGKLTLVQELTDAENLDGATSLRLSPDGKYAIASAFRSQTAVLYRRDKMNGELTQTDVAREGVDGVTGLGFAIEPIFSPDSQFVYVLDAFGSDRAGSGGVAAFRIDMGGKLNFVEANTGKDNCFANARSITILPDGKSAVVAASGAGTLVVLDRDVESGKTTVRQIVRDEADGVHALAGVMGVTLSPDNKFVYTSAGRFRGDHAVGAYKFDEAGKLSVMQEFVNDAGELKNFVGGNEITVSPDGRNVYAVATQNGALACFDRDLKTGRLKYVETLTDAEGRLAGAAGIGLSPDGRFVYVAAEENQMVSIYRRNLGDE